MAEEEELEITEEEQELLEEIDENLRMRMLYRQLKCDALGWEHDPEKKKFYLFLYRDINQKTFFVELTEKNKADLWRLKKKIEEFLLTDKKKKEKEDEMYRSYI